MSDDATMARTDLVAGYRILEVLGKLIAVEDFSENGARGGVVVGAPHQAPRGTPLSGGHDVHTGIVAQRLARALQGKCIVASELRTFVDLNKDPSGARQETSVRHLGRLAFREADRRLKLYYQSQLFCSNPTLVMEIHGHARGVFDLEISAGCQLDETIEQDRVLIAALHTFEATLVHALSVSPSFEALPPTVGVYPLNTDVRFAATGTHTFNKVEKLRELGLNIAGLHIELSQDLRPDPSLPASEGRYEELVQCLTLAIQAFLQCFVGIAGFDFKDRLAKEFSSDGEAGASLSEQPFRLRPIAKELVGPRIASLCRRDMLDLGLQEGHPMLVAVDAGFERHIEVFATTANSLRVGSLGLSRKLRDELGSELDSEVYLGRPPKTHDAALILGYVSVIEDAALLEAVEVGPFLAGELERQLGVGMDLTLSSLSGQERDIAITETDSLPHDRAVSLSTAMAAKLSVTFGDLVCFARAG